MSYLLGIAPPLWGHQPFDISGFNITWDQSTTKWVFFLIFLQNSQCINITDYSLASFRVVTPLMLGGALEGEEWLGWFFWRGEKILTLDPKEPSFVLLKLWCTKLETEQEPFLPGWVRIDLQEDVCEPACGGGRSSASEGSAASL